MAPADWLDLLLEFRDELGEWEVRPDGRIRRISDKACPICAIAKLFHAEIEWVEAYTWAIRAMGSEADQGDTLLAYAADRRLARCDSNGIYRTRMMLELILLPEAKR